MTELRDARLRKAMDEAPDATLQPQQRTREAIRAAAHGAVQPAWRRWWTRSGGSGMPWTAALATIALATLVTVMWEGREVPGARPEAEVVATAPAPAAAPVPAPLPVPATRAGRAEPSGREERTRAAPTAPATGAQPAPVRAPAAPAPVLPDAGGSSDMLARTAPAAEEARAAAAAPPPPPGVAAAPPPPVAAPAPAAQRQAAPAAPTAALRASPASLPWTQVRIESGGRSVVIPRTQAGDLPALVMTMLASPSEDPTTSAPSTLRLELAQGDEAAGVLELVGDHWRWTRLRDARQTRVLRPEPGVAAALRTEAERLLRR